MGMPPFEAAASAVWLHATIGADIGLALTADRLAARIEPIFARKDIQRG
jgi:NAD(P)H-hydrate repair Nnr-like enzyme with NAD(P)H-hydrate dehydratase domain